MISLTSWHKRWKSAYKSCIIWRRLLFSCARTDATFAMTSSFDQPRTLVNNLSENASRFSDNWMWLYAPISFCMQISPYLCSKDGARKCNEQVPTRRFSFAQVPTGTLKSRRCILTKTALASHCSRMAAGHGSRPILREACIRLLLHLFISWSSVRVSSSEQKRKSKSWNSSQPPGFVWLKSKKSVRIKVQVSNIEIT